MILMIMLALKFSINFNIAKTKLCLSLHYNDDSGYLFVNRIYKFKADEKYAIFHTQFCQGSISEKFDYIESEEVSFKGIVYDFSAYYYATDKSDILNICKYLKNRNNKIMFKIIKFY